MIDYRPPPDKAQPADGGGGPDPNGDTSAGAFRVCLHSTTTIPQCNQLTDLQALVREAFDAGDRETFWALRRCYLLAQAVIYERRHDDG